MKNAQAPPPSLVRQQVQGRARRIHLSGQGRVAHICPHHEQPRTSLALRQANVGLSRPLSYSSASSASSAVKDFLIRLIAGDTWRRSWALSPSTRVQITHPRFPNPLIPRPPQWHPACFPHHGCGATCVSRKAGPSRLKPFGMTIRLPPRPQPALRCSRRASSAVRGVSPPFAPAARF